MKTPLFAMVVAAALAALAPPAQAQAECPSTKAQGFIDATNKLNPSSQISPEAVSLACAEGVVETPYQGDIKRFSVNSLADEGAKNGLRAFILTREFIRKLKANFGGTPFPTAGHGYDGIYLNVEERKLSIKKQFP